MQVSHSFWDVCQQYFESGILLPLFAIAVIWLLRKWNKEKRVAFLAVCGVSILLLYNEVTYQVLGLVGESSTYYRFFWICPVALIVACLVVELLSIAKKEQKILLVLGMFVMGFFFSPRSLSDWVKVPENVYQLNEDAIQVADALMELTDGEETTLIDDGSVSDVIRQYNAKIGFTQKYSLYIDYVLRIDTANYLAKYVHDYIYLNESEYVTMPKKIVTTCKLLESAGFERVAETEGYYIYQVDYAQIDEDTLLREELEAGLCSFINIEYVPIAGVGNECQFVYVSDFGAVTDEALYEEVITQIKGSDADCVIINAAASENRDWVEQYEELLLQSGIPYYSNEQDFQIVEMEDFIFCMIENTNGVSAETIEQFETVKTQGKPIVMVLSTRLSDEKQDELYKSITAEDSPVVHILTTGDYPDMKDIVANKLLQYATPVNQTQLYTIIRVKGLDTE